jgi:putative ABC transport system ATP-binding protein
MSILAVEGVTKTYDMGGQAVHALRGVDLAIAGGEVVLLLGPSGSGKTTLISIMGCILRPTQGRVVIDGRDVARLHERELPAVRLRHFGFVFQGFNLFPALTAAENVEVALGLRGVKGRAARAAALGALDAVGLADKAGALPSNLSGGQKQRVAIARALAGDPQIILADEPTAALDSTSGQLVMDVLRTLATDRGRAVVIVTHDNRTFRYADRIVAIEDGRLTAPDSCPETSASGPSMPWRPRPFEGVPA